MSTQQTTQHNNTISTKKCHVCQNTYPSINKISCLKNIGINTNTAKLLLHNMSLRYLSYLFTCA